jgi:hypothetical protein
MQDFNLAVLQADLPRVLFTLLSPIVAHILYVLFAKSQPKLALFLLSIIAVIWMYFAARITYGPPFADYGKSAVSLYVFIATGMFWFAHHQLIRRSGLKPAWFFHIPVVILFLSFCLLLWTFHIAPRLGVPA